MPKTESVTLNAASREPEGSRATRRLRRSGQVPGVVYGAEKDSVAFQVEARHLRQVLAHSSQVFDLKLDSDSAIPVMLKDEQKHPVRGETVHLDLLRVNLNRPVHAVVPIELIGGDDSPGVKQGGVLEQVTREINVEALPTAIPELIEHAIEEMDIGDTLLLSQLAIPADVTLLDDPEGVVANLAAPKLQLEEEEVEEETELVGEGEEGEEGAAEEGEGGEQSSEGGDGDGGDGESKSDSGDSDGDSK